MSEKSESHFEPVDKSRDLSTKVEVTENLVKKTCRELGITQKELAEKIGVSNTTISDWASGKTNISKLAKKTLELLKEEQEFKNFKKIIAETLSSNQKIISSNLI